MRIWSADMVATAPTAHRAFRKTFSPPQGKTATLADIIITADDSYILYVNGIQPCLNVFAVDAGNNAGPAGLLATVQVTYSDGGTATLGTDASWRVDPGMTPGFEQLSFDDNGWVTASVIMTAFWAEATIPQPATVECRPRRGAPEDACASAANGGQYLSAIPGMGCKCLSEPTANWCKPATPDIGTPICSDKTTKEKGREIKCGIADCPKGFTATGPKCEEDEGAFGTISSVTKCKAPSTIYALPGKGGCSCAAGFDAPDGAKKCIQPYSPVLGVRVGHPQGKTGASLLLDALASEFAQAFGTGRTQARTKATALGHPSMAAPERARRPPNRQAAPRMPTLRSAYVCSPEIANA
ncbi:hypothetical protein B0H10DRAFT_2231241 [Mycena sp. CBHHK59/15]|nr:hypothetical protein B0H10DRAFT_2231241 [Mycena sp. CBHHK59/15]